MLTVVHSLSSWSGNVMKVLKGVEKAAEKLAEKEAKWTACLQPQPVLTV